MRRRVCGGRRGREQRARVPDGRALLSGVVYSCEPKDLSPFGKSLGALGCFRKFALRAKPVRRHRPAGMNQLRSSMRMRKSVSLAALRPT